SLTPCYSWVIMEPRGVGTVSTVSTVRDKLLKWLRKHSPTQITQLKQGVNEKGLRVKEPMQVIEACSRGSTICCVARVIDLSVWRFIFTPHKIIRTDWVWERGQNSLSPLARSNWNALPADSASCARPSPWHPRCAAEPAP